ncbi:MAG: anti-sigma factor antagonist [Planctomycetota bacterium]|nr:MAG: anti-sigma factor antagonist [Planctomycetota bacterium]
MKLQTRDTAGVRIVVLAGALDAGSAGNVRQELGGFVKSGNVRLALDLAAVDRIDSTGLGALVTTLKAARDKGGDLVLAGLTPSVRAIVELTRLHRVFEIYGTVDSAAKELER